MATAVSCGKGCGTPVSVPEELFRAAVSAGLVDFSHDVCPKDRDKTPEYRLVVQVLRRPYIDPEDEREDEQPWVLLTQAGDDRQGPTLTHVWPDLVKTVTAQLAKIGGMTKIVETDLD